MFSDWTGDSHSFSPPEQRKLQAAYLEDIRQFTACDIRCPACAAKGKLRYHGLYTRSLLICGEVITLRIFRYSCPICGKTHALLPSFIIPWQRIFCLDLIAILSPSADPRTSRITCLYDLTRRFRKLRDLSAHFASWNVCASPSDCLDRFIQWLANNMYAVVSVRRAARFSHNSCTSHPPEPAIFQADEKEETP